MSGIRRREALLGALIAGAVSSRASAEAASNPYGPDDMTIGRARAPAALIEYASTTCPHCREFYETVWAPLKRNYIDTGKVRYTFREFPTAPGPVALAEFQIARCGAPRPDQYLKRVGTFFDQQQTILAEGATQESILQNLIAIGAQYHLTQDQVMTCINDPAGIDRIRRLMEGAQQFGVNGTPTLILNGHTLDDPAARTYAGLSQMIDAAIAAR